MLHLHAIGMDIHHHGAFSIQRPNGSGDWLLVIFKTDALLTLDGRELPAAPGSVVLFTPGQQQMYRSVTGAYINHFLHFIGDEADDLSALPCGRLLTLSNLREVEELMQLLCRERFGVSCYEDLLAARMNAARYYLQHTELTVREIAALCGYENDVVFMRLFKGRLGVTPTEYRGHM